MHFFICCLAGSNCAYYAFRVLVVGVWWGGGRGGCVSNNVSSRAFCVLRYRSAKVCCVCVLSCLSVLLLYLLLFLLCSSVLLFVFVFVGFLLLLAFSVCV